MVDFYGKLDGGFKYSIFYGWWNTPWKLMIGDGWKFTDTWMVDFLWLLLGKFLIASLPLEKLMVWKMN